MNYYPHHIGDYDSHTAHLTWFEDLAYTRLIRLYYRTEKPLPERLEDIYRLVRANSTSEKKAVLQVLNEFFEKQSDGWHNHRCDVEIEKAQIKAERNREVGKKGGRPRKSETIKVNSNNPEITQMVSENNPNITLPITNNQEPITKEIAAAANNSPGVDPVDNSPPQNDFKNKTNAERSVEIAVQVRQWETARGKSSRAAGNSPHIEVWTEHEITDRQLREAYDLAVEDRIRNEDGGPISPAFLDVFVAKVFQQSESKSALNRPGASTTSKPWQATWSGILAKAAELGIEKQDGEFDPQFKERVFAAAQMTEQEKSVLRADHGVSV